MSDQNNKTTENEDLSQQTSAEESSGAELVVAPVSDGEQDKFTEQLEQTLQETERALLDSIPGQGNLIESWQIARAVVARFRPVPWFIWRLSNYSFGKSGPTRPISEGFVLGLRRLLFAAASDEVLGAGEKINNVRKALKVLSPDVLTAVAVIHAISRRLATKDFGRIWRSVLDEAIMRSRIGFIVGEKDPMFGPGRGMLAGFSSRIGLAILLADGNLEEAEQTIERIANGEDSETAALEVYNCRPVQVSAMALSAAGCGRDSAFGIIGDQNNQNISQAGVSEEKARWRAAYYIVEQLRAGTAEEVSADLWDLLKLEESDKQRIMEEVHILSRRGHGWNWLA